MATGTLPDGRKYYIANNVAEHLAICSYHARDYRWKDIYQRRYPADERYANHEYLGVWAWIAVEQEIDTNKGKNFAYQSWFDLSMPSWWITPDVIEMIKDTNSKGDCINEDELPDEAGLIMLPRGSLTMVDPTTTTRKEEDITGVFFALCKHIQYHGGPGLIVVFEGSMGGEFVFYVALGQHLDGHLDMSNARNKRLCEMTRLALRILQVIHDAKPTIRQSTEQTPAKIKHGEVRPAHWSRRMVGENFRYSRKPHQGGSHRPPRLHRRRAHVRGVWVGSRSSEERHLEERNIKATWVSDGSLSAEEKAQLVALLGSRFER